MVKVGSLVVGIIILLIGAFYAFLPHSTHVASGFGLGLSHGVHIMLGIVLVVAGIIVLLVGKKK